MKKGSKPSEASLERYDWSQARRGRWAGRLRTAHPVLVRPEIYREFGSDEAVNEALAALLQLKNALPRAGKRRRRAA